MSSIKISKENVEIINAFHDGKRVERLWKGPSFECEFEWFEVTDDVWDFEKYEYRISEPRIAKGHNPAKLTEERGLWKEPKLTSYAYLKGQNACGLKVGDKVRVVRKANSYEGGWGCPWYTKDMDKTIGKTCTITDLDESDLAAGFELDGWYWYPYFVLERVQGDARIEIQWPAGTTADDWERVTDQTYAPKMGDLKVWVKEYEGMEAGNTMVIESDFLFTVFGVELGGVLHIYRRKRVPKMPDVPVWWVTENDSRENMWMVARIWHGAEVGFGIACGTRYTLREAATWGYIWSPDRKRWFNFYGEEVK